MVRTLIFCAVALPFTAGCLDWNAHKVDESSLEGGAPGDDRDNDPKPPGTDAMADPTSGSDGGVSGQRDAGIVDTGDRDGSLPACVVDGDCGDTERFRCANNLCVEYECHAARSCSNPLDRCQEHVCMPFVPPERFPTGYSQTSGGGSVASSKYQLRFSAGMPQPFGQASSSKYQIVIGPGAGRP